MTSRSLRRFGPTLALVCLGMTLAMPAGAAGAFDGTYKGPQTVTRTNNTQPCNGLAKDDTVLAVQDSHFKRGWYSTVLDVEVGADGKFHQTQSIVVGRRHEVLQIDGAITGNRLEADIGTSGCIAHLSLTKS